jgi:DNA-binding transcriptional LysR family regulator
MLREAGGSPYGVIEVDSVDTARRLVARGLGIAWLPSTAAVPEVEAGHLTSVQLVDAPAVERRVIALERAEATSWIPVRTMRQLLADVPSFLPGATVLAIEAMDGS